MKTITKYQALDGSEYTDPNKAAARDALCLKVDAAMLPLGDVIDTKDWQDDDLLDIEEFEPFKEDEGK